MKTLIFMASPNKNGNTANMVETFIKELHGQCTVINIFEKNIKPCIDCKYCNTVQLKCSINDDMNEIYNYINEADNIVFSSPVYFAGFPGPMKNMIDRLQIYYAYKYIHKKYLKNSDKKGVLLLNSGIKNQEMFLGMEKTFQYVMRCLQGKVEAKVYFQGTDEKLVNENLDFIRTIKEVAKII
jgi:multimeric flavodoxin WrbA